jgi:hypothetical protein
MITPCDPYEIEIQSYTDAELDDTIAWTEVEVKELSSDGDTYDLESLTINLNLLKAERARRAAHGLVKGSLP